MKRLLFNLYFWPCFLVVTLVGVVITWPAARFLMLVGSDSVDRFVRAAIMVYGWVIVRCIAFMVPVSLHDKTGSTDDAVIFVSNHCSSIEPYLFALTWRQLAFVTTWPFRIPVYRIFMKWAGYINAENGWGDVLREGKRLMERGCSLVIWPEGHRSRSGRLGRFRNGAFYLAYELDCQVVPVCMKGTARVMPPGARWLNPRKVEMVLLPPVRADRGRSRTHSIYDLKVRVREAIRRELEH